MTTHKIEPTDHIEEARVLLSEYRSARLERLRTAAERAEAKAAAARRRYELGLSIERLRAVSPGHPDIRMFERALRGRR